MKTFASIFLQAAPGGGGSIQLLFLLIVLIALFFIVKAVRRNSSKKDISGIKVKHSLDNVKQDNTKAGIIILIIGIGIIIISQSHTVNFEDLVLGKDRPFGGYVGDSQKVESFKNTMLYAGIGLLVFGGIIAASGNRNKNKMPTESSNSITDELSKLHDLKEKGVITQVEFDTRKKKILEA